MTSHDAPYGVAPLTADDLEPSFIPTWDGLDAPVTVVECQDDTVVVETTDGERYQLQETPDGLIHPDEDKPLTTLTVIGTRLLQDQVEVLEYLTDTYEFPTELSAARCAVELELSVEEMHNRLTSLQGYTRASLLSIRDSYDRWLAYRVPRGILSTEDLTAVLTNQTPVENVEADGSNVICTFPEETAAVPRSVVDITYHSSWAIAHVSLSDDSYPSTCTLTPQGGDTE